MLSAMPSGKCSVVATTRTGRFGLARLKRLNVSARVRPHGKQATRWRAQEPDTVALSICANLHLHQRTGPGSSRPVAETIVRPNTTWSLSESSHWAGRDRGIAFAGQLSGRNHEYISIFPCVPNPPLRVAPVYRRGRSVVAFVGTRVARNEAKVPPLGLLSCWHGHPVIQRLYPSRAFRDCSPMRCPTMTSTNPLATASRGSNAVPPPH